MAELFTAALPLPQLATAIVQALAESFPLELVPRVADVIGDCHFFVYS